MLNTSHSLLQSGTTSESVREKFRRIDWDFHGYETLSHLADLHWYPATFVPQLPATLIQALTSDGDVILDPFCGSGVVPVESLLQGRNSVGVESNNLGHFISDVKCRLLLAVDEGHSDTCWRFLERVIENGLPLDFDDNSRNRDLICPWLGYVEELKQWYHPSTLEDLLRIRLEIESVGNTLARDLLCLCFSSIAKSVSSQTKSWGHIADNVKPDLFIEKDAIARFRQQLRRVLQSIETVRLNHWSAVPPFKIQAEVRHNDSRDMSFLPSNSVDLIVTSPPYPKMTDYVLSHRLSYYWMGWDLEGAARLEIGSRRKRFGRRRFDAEYMRDLLSVFDECRRVLKPGRFFSLVLPLFSSTTDQGRQDLINAVLSEALEGGFGEVFQFSRIVPRMRRRHSWPSLDREQVLILEKR